MSRPFLWPQRRHKRAEAIQGAPQLQNWSFPIIVVLDISLKVCPSLTQYLKLEYHHRVDIYSMVPPWAGVFLIIKLLLFSAER